MTTVLLYVDYFSEAITTEVLAKDWSSQWINCAMMSTRWPSVALSQRRCRCGCVKRVTELSHFNVLHFFQVLIRHRGRNPSESRWRSAEGWLHSSIVGQFCNLAQISNVQQAQLTFLKKQSRLASSAGKKRNCEEIGKEATVSLDALEEIGEGVAGASPLLPQATQSTVLEPFFKKKNYCQPTKWAFPLQIEVLNFSQSHLQLQIKWSIKACCQPQEHCDAHCLEGL